MPASELVHHRRQRERAIGIIANITTLTPSVFAIDSATGNMKAAAALRAR
jgi:multisubunit Na+/H+ antiporter MnhE subunit